MYNFYIKSRKHVMAKQKIAQGWKSTTTTFDSSTNKFVETVAYFGRYTQQTAMEKMSVKLPNHTFTKKQHHGFGGYWVAPNGETVALTPVFN